MNTPQTAADSGVRLAELMAALSVATDLGMGLPMEQAMASCIVAVRLGEAAGFSQTDLRDTYYEALLRYVGCNADTAWFASIVGDEMALRSEIALIDSADTPAVLGLMLRSIRGANAGAGPLRMAQAMVRGLAQLGQVPTSFFPGHCEVASRLAERMGFAPSFVKTVGQLYARWDGKGVPALKGEQIAPAMQAVSLAQDAVNFFRVGGTAAVRKMAQERSGKAHSPHLCRLLSEHCDGLLAGLQDEPVWDQVLALEPGEPVRLSEWQLDAACEAMGDFADLKSPHHLGHSRRVSQLAAAAAQHLGLADAEVARVRRAGGLHDIGRCGVSAELAARTGPLTDRQWEQMRLHPYHTGRILARPQALAQIGEMASMHHERSDGSGYFQGRSGATLPLAARVLAAADRYCALRETRPHRAAADDAQAAATLLRDAQEGKLDAQAVGAALHCAGHRVPRNTMKAPAGLSERELEVLRHLARGHTLKAVARDLGLSVKTVDRHVQNIYAKAGVSTRAGATLFAVENQLLD
ncbi:MAG: HD domain-containing protein [Burkholderiales bacterium]|nr:HD domain-containing protein [Burkholderiales bacterium]